MCANVLTMRSADTSILCDPYMKKRPTSSCVWDMRCHGKESHLTPAKWRQWRNGSYPKMSPMCEGSSDLHHIIRIKFVPDFAKTAGPLHALTRQGVAFQWTRTSQQAFKELKDSLTNTPVLAYPGFAKSFVVKRNASKDRLRAVLPQEQEH